MRRYYDVVITGAGMVGSVLACKLARNPVLHDTSILLIEGASKKVWRDILQKNPKTYCNRVSALNNATKIVLEKLDVWDTINSAGCRKVLDMKVWSHASNTVCTTFKSSELVKTEALAYIVENDILIAAIMEKLEEFNDNVNVFHNTVVTNFNFPPRVHQSESKVVLNLNDDTTIECSLLLGTDGVNSKVRQAMGVQYLNWNYNQRCVVATLKVNENNGNYTAWQKFVRNGPIALLPLSEEFSSLVWTTTPEHAKQLLSIPDESFVDALNTALWQEPTNDTFSNNISDAIVSLLKKLNINDGKEKILPPIVTDVKGSRASFPIGFGHAASYVTPNVALVGDAAHRVHPLAGQGVNLGFGDVECLDAVLTKGLMCGAPLGDIKFLRDYETERQRCNIPKLVGIELIHRVAGHPWPPLLAVTNVGFHVTSAIPLLKKFFMKTAAL